jgi:hypothetical protein
LVSIRKEGMFISGTELNNSVPKDKLRISDVLFGEKGREKRGKLEGVGSSKTPAAIRGLYGHGLEDRSRKSANFSKVKFEGVDLTFGEKVKCKFV